MLVIKKSGTYTIKNTAAVATGTGIRVMPGLNVNLIFAGVNISGAYPMEIVTNSHVSSTASYLTEEVDGSDVVNPTRVHIMLADGTTNNLCSLYEVGYSAGSQPHGYQFPGLRCGEGSYLTIDDAVLNVDTVGNHITPVDGAIPDGTTYVDRTGTVRTADSTKKKESERFNSLSNLESSNPGVLNVYGGVRSAAIGGGPLENSGVMTFDGGTINTYAAAFNGNGAGCGIGGGHAGGSTQTTINGGVIYARSSFHGAAIGGGCTYVGGMSSYLTFPLADALLSRNANSTIAGDITINGGFTTAQGDEHSNAFGQGCGGSNTGKTILITGGTLYPLWGGGGGFLEIGGDGGKVIITGGSINCTRFQGNDNDGKAYGGKTDENGNYLFDSTNKVAMINVKVGPKIESMVKQLMRDKLGDAYDESTIASNPEYQKLLAEGMNAKIESWEFKINDMPMEPYYGAPARLQNGILYLWLPEGTYGRDKVDANFSYYVGDQLLTSYTNVPANPDSADGTIKEWEVFELDEAFIEANWSKYYDGVSLDSAGILGSGGISVNNPPSGKLTDANKLTFGAQKMDELGNGTAASTSSSKMPADSGMYNVEVMSSQYASDTNFAVTYWGHRAYGTATVSPISSRSVTEVPEELGRVVGDDTYTSPVWLQDEAPEGADFNTALQNHMFVPVDVTSYKVPFGDTYKDGSDTAKASCVVPQGRITLYLDGVQIPARLGGVIDYRLSYDDTGKPVMGDNGSQATTNSDVVTYVDDDGRMHAVAYFDLNEKKINELFRSADYRANNTFDKKVAEAGPDDPAPLHEVHAVYTSAVRDNLIDRDDVGQAVEGYSLEAPQDEEPAEERASDDAAAATVGALAAGGELDPAAFGALVAQKVLLFAEGADDETGSLIAKEATSAGIDGVAPRWSDSGYENYYESTTPVTFVDIAMVDPTGTLYNEMGQPQENPDGTNSYDRVAYDPALPVDASNMPSIDDKYKASYVVEKPVEGGTEKEVVCEEYKFYHVTDFRDSETSRASTPDWFPVYLTTNSLGDVTFTSSDPAAVTFDPATVTNREYEDGTVEYGIGARAHVNSAGKVTLKARVAPNGAYNGLERSFTLYIYPDLSEKPVLDMKETAYDTSRSDGTIRPGDVLAYTATLTNTTPDSALFRGKMQMQLPDTLEVGRVFYTDPNGVERELDPSEYTVTTDPATGESTIEFTSTEVLYGLGQMSLTVEAAVKADVAWRALTDPDSVSFHSTTTGSGVYGIGDSDFDWDTRYDYVDGTPTDEANAECDPTLPPEREPEQPKPPYTPDELEDILGGGLVDPEPGAPDDLDDPDTPAKSDIVVTKELRNVTPGFADRGNTYALVGDTLEYTIVAKNLKEGTAWLAAQVYDPLPQGVAYVPGSAVITDQFGKQHAVKAEDELHGEGGKLGFNLGDIYGGKQASVTFKVTVTADAVADGAPVPSNVAYGQGTKPSDTVVYPEGTDPDTFDPTTDLPIEIQLPDPTPGTFDPGSEDEKDKWEEEDPDNPGTTKPKDLLPTDPAKPDGTSHTDPDHGKFSTVKDATVVTEHEGAPEGTVYVGDVVAYTITFANHDEPWTAWYNVTLYDKLPKGLAPVAGSFALKAPGADEAQPLDDSVYNAQSGDISVYVGRVLGGQEAVLTFQCTVTDEAVGSDIGNTAAVYGTDPSKTEPSVLDGTPGATPGVGDRYAPEEGWDGFVEDNGSDSANFSSVSYPDSEGPVDVVDPNGDPNRKPTPLPSGDGNGNGAPGGSSAATGDSLPVTALAGLAFAAFVVLATAFWRRRADALREQAPRGKHVR